MKFGRRKAPSPITRSATGTPASPSSFSLSRAAFCRTGRPDIFRFQPHQLSSEAWPSSVPLPVTATFSCSNAEMKAE